MDQQFPENDRVQELSAEASAPRLQHSGLGIASFIIAMTAMLFTVITFICFATIDYASMQELLLNNQMTDEEIAEVMMSTAPQLIIGVLLFFLTIFLAFIGGILGIVALAQKNRKKIFAIIGTIINWLLVLFVVFFFILGLMMQL